MAMLPKREGKIYARNADHVEGKYQKTKTETGNNVRKKGESFPVYTKTELQLYFSLPQH
jgi:hypothetical protein